MRYHKLKAGECPGTYVVTEPVTEQDLLRIANQIARKRLAKGEDVDAVLKSLAHGLSQKFLHGAYSQLHQLGHADPEHREKKTELIRDLFGLNKTNSRNH